ncbi:hypothetical protein Sgleb_73750 [Streptomyces glebosus]|uniref:Uncharacterized protein n=1 Tax=Streptomyces glebosus TaxID=249580 RepID=A0A640T7P9_9ACTN|nr:TauD/TfdA family dioxygenase [Streptomyces glebosus]GFE19328.1 hypothetical protein Sgleb_73750 [Streptomyces glebosus]GHG62345.1 hypothetical protein GCM10010513_28970 [Streptomyces glebosus]
MPRSSPRVARPATSFPTVGTNLNANPGQSTGTGYNAFHMDLANATVPPDYITLLCVRPDPLGAGASILSNAPEAVSRLILKGQIKPRRKNEGYGRVRGTVTLAVP